MGVYKMYICFLPTLCLHRGLRFRMTYKNTEVRACSIDTKILIIITLSEP